jgi:hypothetical protein
MCRAAAREVRNMVRTAVTIGRSKSAGDISTSGVPCTSWIEIRLKQMSIPPAPAATASACWSTARSSKASTTAVSATPPTARTCSATRSSGASVRPARWTLAPSRANAPATGVPMAPPPP